MDIGSRHGSRLEHLAPNGAKGVTWIFNGPHAWSPAIAGWLEQRWVPSATRDLKAMGHVPGPYLMLRDDADPAKGILDVTAGIRFSQGYGHARHLPP